ncbi:hypothetical protein [Vibrio harveyi]|uniref:hypothetical protein n=1 Tax=Vibrio harveyi TaxID=669 RepID=UPI0023802572|nr:hypothetical protein [Vibrio harveyi]
MFKKWIAIISMFAAMNVVAEEPLLSDCAMNSRTESINDFNEYQSQCVEDIIENNTSEMFDDMDKVKDSSIEMTQGIVENYKEILILLGGMLGTYYLIMLMKGKLYNKSKAQTVFIMLSGFAFSTIIYVPNNLGKFITFAVKEQVTNFTEPMTSVNNYLANTEDELTRQISQHIPEINAKVDEAISNIIEAETCAMEYRQTVYNGYAMDEGFIYEESEIGKCLIEKQASAPSFLQSGRSPLNYAVKECSFDYDTGVNCGAVAMSKMEVKGQSTYNPVSSIISSYSDQIANWTQEASILECSKQDEALHYSLCREFKNKEFSIAKATTTKNALDSEFKRFVLELRDAVQKEVISQFDITQERRAIKMLNPLDQTMALLRTTQDYESTGTQTTQILRSIIPMKGYKVDAVSNQHFDFDSTVQGNIVYVDQLYSHIRYYKNNLFSDSSLNKGAVEEALKYVLDPKLMFGDYRNNIDKEDYELDFLTTKTIGTMGEYIFFTTTGFKLAATSVFNATTDQALKSKLKKLIDALDWLQIATAASLAVYFAIFYIFAEAFMFIVLAAPLLIVKALIIWSGKKDPKLIIGQVISLFMTVRNRVMAILIAIAATHAAMALSFEMIDHLDLFNDGSGWSNLKDLIQSFVVIASCILFSSLVFFKVLFESFRLLQEDTKIEGQANVDSEQVDAGSQSKVAASYVSAGTK